uniref:Solute carrier family 15 member 2 n=1 Tax=Coturnix japonica TaxID=93934 RepID=A0A8C2UGE6_COTJA
MNTFQRNESKESLFTFISAGDDPPKGDFPVQKKSPKLCGSNYPLSIAFIVVNEFCERFSYYGMRGMWPMGRDYPILVFLYMMAWRSRVLLYMVSVVFQNKLQATTSDNWLGKYKTIIYLSIVYVVGHLIKSVGAIPSLGNQAVHVVLFMVGLFLIALGTGGIKPCISAFGGDQFEEEHTSERSKFFSVFYLSINAGSLISTFVTPVLRGDVKCFGEDCYALAFGVPAALMVLALVVFIAGSGLYRKTPPQGNVLLEVCKCIGFAIKNRLKNRSRQIPKRDHWLDWASEKYSKELIGEVKMVTRVLFLFLPLPMFWALFDQQVQYSTLQGIYVLQPDQMQFLNPLLILVFIPIFDLGLYPLISMCKFNFTPIRKMATGMILAGMAFGLAAIVEVKINVSISEAIPQKYLAFPDMFVLMFLYSVLFVCETNQKMLYFILVSRYDNGKCITETGEFTLDLGLLDFGASYTVVITNVSGGAVQTWKSEDIKANNVHMAWQLPQYLLISAGEVMFSITGLAFSYSQSPASMKSVLQAGWLLTVAVGNTLVLVVAQAAPMAQWAEFVLFTVLLFAVCIIFSIMGYFYVSVDPEDLEEKEEKRETPSRGNMISLVTQKTKL